MSAGGRLPIPALRRGLLLGWLLLAGLAASALPFGAGAARAADDPPPTDGSPPAALRPALTRWAAGGAVAVALDGVPEWVHGDGRDYVPASILKLATALAALEQLGPDYRFTTEIYRDRAGHLYLRGFGDPRLVSEEWQIVAGALSGAGVFAEPLGDLVVDGSAVADEPEVDGRSDSLNPYDARLGALVSNFNTMLLRIGADGSVGSAEPQTPLTPLALELGAGLRPGVRRINLSREPGRGARYTGELVRAIFSGVGARFTGGVHTGTVPPDAELLLRHRSTHTLRDVVRDMMEFSNNFMANQLLLVLDLETSGPPARLSRGVEALRDFLTVRVGLDPASFHLVEGSGLSRENRIGPRAMLRIADAFHPWRELLHPFGNPPLQAPAKTGSLKGISTLAGYLPAPDGFRRTFVILLEQSRHTRQRMFEALLRHYRESGE